MRSFILISVAAVALVACGGKGSGDKTGKSTQAAKASLEASCETMAKASGKAAPKGACKCMSDSLKKSLSAEDVQKVAKAFSAMKKPEDAMTAMAPLAGNADIMTALANVEKACKMQ